MSDFSLLILGAGGHGQVVADALLEAGRQIFGYLDADRSSWGARRLGLSVIGGDERLADFPPGSVRLVNGIGSVDSPQGRRLVFEVQTAKGYVFERVIHPRACVSRHAELGDGVQVMAGAVIQAGAKIEDNVIINTGALVDHDCVIGPHSHVAPGATLSGGVSIGANCHIGTGAVMIQGVKIGENCLVGAGAVVIRSHPPFSRLAGVPAKIMKTQ